ncbi:MAG: helix-turn-helix transcriptional regulator [Burkholderiales bacterium]|nr:helix-turn-helix transcriptional regulator [Burkholderiales bacterium]
MTDTPAIRFGRFTLHPASRSLQQDAQPVAIGARAFDVLAALVERRDRVVGKNELLDVVWPGVVVEENNLQVQISALRKLLGPQAIATIPGRGYRFVVPLDGDGRRPARVETPAPGPAQPGAGVATASAASMPGNLPQIVPPLFGRDVALPALQALIDRQALVTLVGAGGMGKTALARAVAHVLRDEFPDGVWWVDLAPLADPAQVPLAVAAALRLTLEGSGTAQEQLLGALGDWSALLVLDNCEHVVDAAAALAAAILERAGGVRLLVTSQELLHIPGEHIFKLEPLAVPAVDGSAQGTEFGALQLFVERARAVEPRFTLDAGNTEAVADICRRLDGMPLAIELAAARVRLLGVQRLRDGLGERFRLLTGGARTAPRRHQTLRAAIDWSHAMLAADEQAIFRRLGVFVGGFTLELAQQVASDEHLDAWAVLDGLSALVDKSLVVADAGEPVRYRLLETTRAYALEKLADAHETPILLERHARAMCDLFVQTWNARQGERVTLSLAASRQLLEPELENARAAFAWAAGAGGDTATAIVLAAAVARLLFTRGQSQEALRTMQAIIERVDDAAEPVRAAWFWEVYAAFGDSGRVARAAVQAALSRAEDIWRRRGERPRLYGVLCARAWSLYDTGHHAEADALLPEILALEDPGWSPLLRTRRLSALINGAMLQGRLEEALRYRLELEQLCASDPADPITSTGTASVESLIMLGLERYEEVLDIARAFDQRFGSNHHDALRWVQAHRTFALMFLGRIDEAAQALRRGIAAWRRDGLLLRYCGHLALLVAEQGRYADAARVDGAAEAHIARSGMVRDPSVPLARKRLQQIFDHAKVDPRDIERWRREGEALDEAALARLCVGGDGQDAGAA